MGEPPKNARGAFPWDDFDAAALLSMRSDVSLFLSDELLILEVFVTEPDKFNTDLRGAWKEKPFTEIVAKDSKNKIEALLVPSNDSSSIDPKWRHLNFLAEDGVGIPLLAKRFNVQTPHGQLAQVVCRDLRPMTELNRRWQRENTQLLQEVSKAKSERVGRTFAHGLVGSAPLSDIVAAAVDEVAKICISEALKLREGDEKAAADLLGITLEELRLKSRKRFH